MTNFFKDLGKGFVAPCPLWISLVLYLSLSFMISYSVKLIGVNIDKLTHVVCKDIKASYKNTDDLDCGKYPGVKEED